jgi:hypothetical protein
MEVNIDVITNVVLDTSIVYRLIMMGIVILIYNVKVLNFSPILK